MLKILLSIFGLCLVGALAAPADVDHTSTTVPPVAIVDSGQEKHEDGSYHFFYQGEDGTRREETAVVQNAGTGDAFLEVSGTYSYFDADGKEVVVNYKADNYGFVPEGGNILPQITLAAKLASEQRYPLPDTDYKKPPQNE
ncbi:endocuticle structural glycoprotein ABD-5-like [Drosophila novamexicana]|uniref:endocuticle structural glycoprotein ABD-5 n=1 Tax=Drosophila novamexicana TaxID=47314 RepID=UPI0011E5DAA7|nr:endocuticle structural glycoprotein ABD-5 [Drosophila novamexicana]XP_030570093.1 endocuticle structural glycoprotein ABD-5-like [Drosophila novamexicana]